MKPVAIFRHSQTEGPGYIATFLDARRINFQLVKVDAREPVPADPRQFSGLVFMGGPMSVNDVLPWIPEVLGLVQKAVDADIPVLGHCLGGQLMAKALGGRVTRNGVKEIGWGPVTIEENARAREWFGARRDKHLGMQCHVEMTPELIRAWCEDWEKELVAKAGPSVQTPQQMFERLDERVHSLNAIAADIYGRWIEGLKT